jgi:hypothetical protein
MECADIGAPQRDGRVCSSLAVAIDVANFLYGQHDSVATREVAIATRFIPLQDAHC